MGAFRSISGSYCLRAKPSCKRPFHGPDSTTRRKIYTSSETFSTTNISYAHALQGLACYSKLSLRNIQ